MASIAPSDSESNVSGFMRYSDKDVKYLYTSIIQVRLLLFDQIPKTYIPLLSSD